MFGFRSRKQKELEREIEVLEKELEVIKEELRVTEISLNIERERLRCERIESAHLTNTLRNLTLYPDVITCNLLKLIEAEYIKAMIKKSKNKK